ncbi:hypothetical protein E2C01_061710 [Portunus trituberculatus]|uniref:Uncharacterized protein n=1 Tax=Portunus trituberculatus TaxID=210409 RepID=A0A5B7HBQ4_PORTR|nr:hypothetical protein [Portunus trituberculatus]
METRHRTQGVNSPRAASFIQLSLSESISKSQYQGSIRSCSSPPVIRKPSPAVRRSVWCLGEGRRRRKMSLTLEEMRSFLSPDDEVPSDGEEMQLELTVGSH